MNDLRLPDMFDRDPFESTFRSLLRPWRAEGMDRTPQIRIDVSEDDSQYDVNAEIPGVRKEDIDVRVDGHQVTISAEVKQEHDEKKAGRVLRSERQYGYCSRSFTLAEPVDESKADAKYDNGVLHLTLPKRSEPEQKRLSIT